MGPPLPFHESRPMSLSPEASLHRTLGNLETGLQHLTNEVQRSNRLLEARSAIVENRLSSLENLRDRVKGGVVVTMGVAGIVWAVVKAMAF